MLFVNSLITEDGKTCGGGAYIWQQGKILQELPMGKKGYLVFTVRAINLWCNSTAISQNNLLSSLTESATHGQPFGCHHVLKAFSEYAHCSRPATYVQKVLVTAQNLG